MYLLQYLPLEPATAFRRYVVIVLTFHGMGDGEACTATMTMLCLSQAWKRRLGRLENCRYEWPTLNEVWAEPLPDK